ncbi:hypothetical protein FRC12_004556 [Ceratobasidium sp. 428]|nr:hypothetical protein FRC12_004556 [Ceratobasidium sp. 428]
MSNLFSGNQTHRTPDLKTRLEALEARYKRDVTALSQRIYNAEGEIHELRALNASLTDSLEDFRRRIGEIETFKDGLGQPQRGSALPNNIADQPVVPPSREPRAAHPASSGPLAYRPNRRSSYGPPPVHPRRHDSAVLGLTPENRQEGALPRTTGTSNLPHNATDVPRSARSMSSGTNSFREGTISPPAMAMSPDSTRSSATSEGAANAPLAAVGRIVVSIDFGADFTTVAYATNITERITQIVQWPGSDQNMRRIPTCLRYNERGEVQTWGIEAQVRVHITYNA